MTLFGGGITSIRTTRRFDKDYDSLPKEIKDAVDSKLALFILSHRHPSLRMKKMQGTQGIWEMRITDSYRITFQIIEGTVILRRVGTHDVLRLP